MGLGVDEVGEVYVSWASPTLSSAASIAGHLGVVVESFASGDGEPELRAFSMLASTDEAGSSSFLYAVYGLTGGFSGRVMEEPFHGLSYRYLREENRDVILMRWVLDRAEKERLLARLDELQLYWDRPYFFFQRNCGALVTELWEAVCGEPLRIPMVVPPDMILSQMARRGKLEPCQAPVCHQLSSVTQALWLKGERRQAVREMGAGGRAGPVFSRRGPVRDAGYGRLLDHALTRPDEPEVWEGLARVVLVSAPMEQAVRSKLSNREEPEVMEDFDAAVAQVRERVPVETRLRLREGIQEKVEGARAKISLEHAPMNTPYTPFDVSFQMRKPYLGEGFQFEPYLGTGRVAMELRRGEPRMFAPAQGIQVLLMSVMGAIGLNSPHRFHSNYKLLTVEYQPEPILGNMAGGVGMDLLNVRMEYGPFVADAEWVGHRGILRLLGGQAGRSRYLNGYVGFTGGSRVRVGPAIGGRSGLFRGIFFKCPLLIRGCSSCLHQC